MIGLLMIGVDAIGVMKWISKCAHLTGLEGLETYPTGLQPTGCLGPGQNFLNALLKVVPVV